MRPRSLSFGVLLCGVIAACSAIDTSADDQPAEGEEDLQAEATFAMASASDCVSNFAQRPFMALVASRRGWNAADIESFCAKLDTIKNAYVNDATFTTVSFAGTSKLDGQAIENSYYIGATAYDLTAMKQFVQAIVGDAAVRRCLRRTVARRVLTGAVPPGFVVSCLEDESGAAFPEALFRVRLSNVQLGELADAGAGAGINITMITVPGVGVVVGLLGGAFYAEASPPFGTFIGCGTLLGFGAEGAAAASPICLAAEFANDESS